MSTTSDKLSASIRKAKAQGAERPGAQSSPTATAAEAKKPASRARKPRPTASKPRAERKPDMTATPESSHNELFPARVWPD